MKIWKINHWCAAFVGIIYRTRRLPVVTLISSAGRAIYGPSIATVSHRSFSAKTTMGTIRSSLTAGSAGGVTVRYGGYITMLYNMNCRDIAEFL